ncbi:MAG: hypothetical protein DHS20C18_27090 [Saprospiraceae bacterium]|nr:MAG: hypothetical protein DHS20C18_27090 [Saprospiraceae bacterium]
MRTTFTLILLSFCTFLFSQTFTKITTGPIATDTPTGGYAGVSWVDYDGDGDIDLFLNQDFLYQNDGNGNFTRIFNSGIVGISIGYNNGNSWADIDNDGDLDLVLVNRSSNGVFTNNGDGTFTKITTGDIATNLNAWSAAWADYDNDGWVDLVATHPCGISNPCHTNWLFNNNGDGSFTEITNSDVNMGLRAYTVGNWADFDDDGDMDLFIGSGEVSVNSKDHIYINQLTETGSPDLVLNQTGVLFGDFRDGQNWNLIDYDNDGDLDAFVTNFKEDLPNDFYKNNGDGTFTRLTDADLGVHMVSEAAKWLANTWGDFNNDGWLDVFITADYLSPFGNHFYLSNGDGTFAHHFPAMANIIGTRSAANGDYDNDGDLDLFMNSTQSAFRGLYRNNLNPGAGENWINLTLEGTISNRSAIGAKIRVKATINGQTFWQRRDISSQNAFCGQNSMRVHFGLGDAASIDSLIIEWPLGLKESFTNISSNQFLQFVEGQTTAVLEPKRAAISLNVHPNPFSEATNITLQINSENNLDKQAIKLSVLDASQKEITTLFNGKKPPGIHEFKLNTSGWAPGSYYLILESEASIFSKTLIIVR